MIDFTVNGKPVSVDVYPMERLLDVLRDHLALTGTKEGCGEGECGACSVFIDGELVNSCLVPAMQVAGCDVKTIESIAGQDELHPVQQAFLETGGAQCGICTPGMVMAAVNLIEQAEDPKKLSLDDIREGLAGNLCRCTGYTKIFEAVAKAAKGAKR